MPISELHNVPEFAGTIADRGWGAWWRDSDVSLSQYQSAIERMAETNGIPTALVMHVGADYVGSVLLVDNDLEERPQFSPWIAALWVETDKRRQGVASKLIHAARHKAGGLGHETCYLCATPKNSSYYLKQGLQMLEQDVHGLNVFSISSEPNE